jgi:hypothetical protein
MEAAPSGQEGTDSQLYASKFAPPRPSQRDRHCNERRRAAMTGAAANNGAFLGPIIHVDDACLQVQTCSETDNLTFVATLEIRNVPGARVDRDHDHLLREFMEARDE